MRPALRWAGAHAEALVLLAVVPVVLGLRTPGGIVLLGVVSGIALALQATGIVLVYRSNRFIDFAQLQIGAVAATLFTLLINARPLFRAADKLCPPCLDGPPSSTQVAAHYWLALLLSLAFAVALGWVVYVAVVRKLQHAPRLVLTVASLFLITALASVQKLLVYELTTDDQKRFGGMTRAVPPPWHLDVRLGTHFGTADLLMVVVGGAALAGTAIYLARSRTGNAIRATAESPARAQTLGVDVARVTGRVWMLVGGLSGITALIAAMSAPAGTGDQPLGGSSVVRVLVAVVLARFTSLPLAVAGSVGFGVLSQSVQYAAGSTTVLDGCLVLVVSGLLLVQRRQQTRSDRDTSSAFLAGRHARPIPRELRQVRSVRGLVLWFVAAVTIVLLAVPFLLSPKQNDLLVTAVIYAIGGLSLLVLTGWAGQVSLGQFGLAAVGAWVAAASGLPFLVAVPLGAVAGAVVAVVLGGPALRLQGLTLAVSTLAFAASAVSVLLNPDLLGGVLPTRLDRPLVLGLDLSDQRTFYYVVLLLLAVSVMAVAGLRRSRTARVLVAARDNEAATQSFGISVLRARLSAFAVSGFLAAMAGSLFAYQQGTVGADDFSVDKSLLLLTFTVIGGLGSIAGPLVGFVAYAVLTLSTSNPGIIAFANGVGGVALLLLAPGGLAQVGYALRDGLLRRIAGRGGIRVAAYDDGSVAGVAPITPRVGVFVPQRYSLDDQWATTPQARAAVGPQHD